MRRFATLLLAVLAVGASAQPVQRDARTSTLDALVPLAQTAAADTIRLSNRPAGSGLSLYTFGGDTNFVTGTNDTYTSFGSGYTLPDDGEYQVISYAPFLFDIPAGMESFSVSVYNGTLEDGPVGEPVYTEAFSTSILVAPDGNTVSPSFLDFATPAVVEGPVFFVTLDLSGVTGDLSVVSTTDLDTPTPETVIFIDGEWVQIAALFAGENPLQIYLLDFVEIQVAGAEAEPVSIATARGSSGSTVTVEGTVTRSEGGFTYLQDETGGLAIRQTSGDFFDQVTADTIRPGTVLRVTGTLSSLTACSTSTATRSRATRSSARPTCPRPRRSRWPRSPPTARTTRASWSR